MEKTIAYDYDDDLDILHVYSSEIAKGVKGGLSYGDFTIDVGINNKVVGVEIEEASKVLNLLPSVLNNLDKVDLLVRKVGNTLFVGVKVWKSKVINSIIQVPVPYGGSQPLVAR